MNDNIGNGSQIGKAYVDALQRLDFLMQEVDSFNDQFGHSLVQQGISQKINTSSYVQKINTAISLLKELEKPITFMAEVERRDR